MKSPRGEFSRHRPWNGWDTFWKATPSDIVSGEVFVVGDKPTFPHLNLVISGLSIEKELDSRSVLHEYRG
jgi:hypothetical protein